MRRMIAVVLVLAVVPAIGLVAQADHTGDCLRSPNGALHLGVLGLVDGRDDGCTNHYTGEHCDLWVEVTALDATICESGV